MNRLYWTNSVTLKYKRMCSRNCCLALGLYQYPRHKPTAYREGVSEGFVLCLYFDDCFPQTCFFYFCLPLFHFLTDRGAETRGGGGGDGEIYPPNNLTISPNNLTLVCIWAQVSTRIWGTKFSFFRWRPFFWSSLYLLTWKKSWSRFISPKLKVGQNWGKIASYSPQCSTKIGTPAHPTF